LILALVYTTYVHFECGNYTAANVSVDELVALADEKGASYWKVVGGLFRGLLFAVTSRASDAVPTISSNLAAFRAPGTKMMVPLWLSYLSRAYAGIGQLDLAWHSIEEALTMAQATGERWIEAEVHRTAGEVALVGPKRDAAKAETYFDRALAIAHQQQAKSWELRAATSLAALWRDQGKVQQARELLAPVYGWFTEGFDTLDLKEAKALLEEFAA
jgi:predicted ATPase